MQNVEPVISVNILSVSNDESQIKVRVSIGFFGSVVSYNAIVYNARTVYRDDTTDIAIGSQMESLIATRTKESLRSWKIIEAAKVAEKV